MALGSSPHASGLNFLSFADLGIGSGFTLNYNCADKAAPVYLCVGESDNRVKVSGTTPLSRQPDVLDAINNLEKWGLNIPVWLVAETPGASIRKSQVLQHTCHVRPYAGKLKISSFQQHLPKLTYPGNGKGRLLSEPIKGFRYFIYGGRLETDPVMRGFDCTSFPMVLFSVKKLPSPGYGKQLCETLHSQKCDLEALTRSRFEDLLRLDAIPNGIYLFFSGGHVLLYNSDINIIYEFNHGGFFATPGWQRAMATPDLWWVRKLDEKYRPLFT